MLCLIQRVASAKVKIGSKTVGQIGHGMLVFVCAMATDTDETVAKAARKAAKLRIFRDRDGRMNKSVNDVDGAMLIVSQFTLGADTSRGHRPGFSSVAGPEEGLRLYGRFVHESCAICPRVSTGSFGAEMAVSLVNDGPVTIWLDVQ